MATRIDRLFEEVIPLAYRPSSILSFRSYYEDLFRNVSVKGKSLLDVGGGVGIFSMYAACQGAAKALCLEPAAAGATNDVHLTFIEARDKLGLGQIEYRMNRLQDIDAVHDRFDIILLHNSINHLDEAACMALPDDLGALRIYTDVFESLQALSVDGATIIIADCSPKNFFARVGVKNPFAPSIEWRKHQPPSVWIDLLREAGFQHIETRWPTHPWLGILGRRILANWMGSFFLTSYYQIFARKVAPATEL